MIVIEILSSTWGNGSQSRPVGQGKNAWTEHLLLVYSKIVLVGLLLNTNDNLISNIWSYIK